jgi:hypothetical protein
MPAMPLKLMLAILIWASVFFAPRATAQNAASSTTGGLEGKFELQQRDGRSIIPQGTKIWILYGPSSGCVVGGQIRSPIDCHIELPADRFLDSEFSCEGKFDKAMQQIRDGLSDLKSPKNDVERQQQEKLSAQLNAYYTRCGDAAVAKTMAWAQKHPNDDWQTRVAVADENGHWSAAGLRSGHYILIIRADFGTVAAYSLDTDPLSVEPGKMQTVRQLNPLLSERAASP